MTLPGFSLRPDPTAFWAGLPSQPDLRLGVTRLGPHEIGLIAPHGTLLGSESALFLKGHETGTLGPLPVAIRWHGQEGFARVECLGRSDGQRLGGMVAQLARSGLLAEERTNVTTRERIVDRARIEALLAYLIENRGPTLVVDHAGNVVTASLSARSASQLPLDLWTSAPMERGPLLIKVGGVHARYRFLVQAQPIAADRWAAHLPSEILRERHRAHRRVPALAGTTVSFRHPSWSDLLIERPVADLSADGLSFLFDPSEHLVYSGLEVPQAHVHFAGGESLSVGFEVTGTVPSREGLFRCGVRLLDHVSRHAWNRRVARASYPDTRSGGVWSKALWNVYERSGYFTLSEQEPGRFSHLRADFADAQRRVDAMPELGCTVVSQEADGSVRAALSLLRVYEHTWMGYQMAKVPGRVFHDGARGGAVLRAVHLHAYEQALASPDMRWVLGYVQAGRRWSRWVHHDFPARFTDRADQAAVVRFRAIRALTDTPSTRSRGVEVRAATPEELRLTLARVAEYRPVAYLEALDLVPERFELDAVKARFAKAGLTRDREALVACVRDRVVALVVCECAEHGLHLFDLLDVAWLHPLSATARRPDVVEALMGGARRWFATRGRSRFVLFDEHDMIEPGRRVWLEDLGEAHLTVLCRDRVPDLLEWVCEVTAPRHLLTSGDNHHG